MEIRRLDPIVVIGLPVEGKFEDLATAVPRGWTQLWDRRDEIPGRTSDQFTELSRHLGEGRYREVLGARVDPSAQPPAGMVRVEVPAGLYVHAVEAGPVEGIAATFGAMQDHAVSQGFEPDGVLVDDGYSPNGQGPHSLYVRLRDDPAGP